MLMIKVAIPLLEYSRSINAILPEILREDNCAGRIAPCILLRERNLVGLLK